MNKILKKFGGAILAVTMFVGITGVALANNANQLITVTRDADDILENYTFITYPTGKSILGLDGTTHAPFGMVIGDCLQVNTSTLDFDSGCIDAGDMDIEMADVDGLTSALSDMTTSIAAITPVNADWSAASGLAQILNKPSLFSGAYSDLTGKPTLFGGSWNNLSDRPAIAATLSDLEDDVGYMLASNNLSDISSASTARTNLGLGTAATSASTAFATAAQGAKADTAIQTETKSDWNASSGAAQILNKPTTVSGYGITDAVPTSRTVNGHALTANVTVTKSDVSLGNADNTSDASKPISTATQTALDLKSRAYEGTTLRANSFPIFKSATVGSGVAVFHLTADGTSGGTALFPNGIIQDSIDVEVNDATASFQMSYALTNSNKTLTVTANKLTTSNILTGILGQAAANGSVIRLIAYGY